MDIDKFQKAHRRYLFKKDAKRGLSKTFMWFTEEVGELSRALRENNKEELGKRVCRCTCMALFSGKFIGYQDRRNN